MGWRKGPRVNKRRWEAVRLLAFDRDGWRCVDCGKAGRLEGDHIKPLADGGAIYDLENVATRCTSCHLIKTLADRGIYPDPEQLAWRSYLRTVIIK